MRYIIKLKGERTIIVEGNCMVGDFWVIAHGHGTKVTHDMSWCKMPNIEHELEGDTRMMWPVAQIMGLSIKSL